MPEQRASHAERGDSWISRDAAALDFRRHDDVVGGTQCATRYGGFVQLVACQLRPLFGSASKRSGQQLRRSTRKIPAVTCSWNSARTTAALSVTRQRRRSLRRDQARRHWATRFTLAVATANDGERTYERHIAGIEPGRWKLPTNSWCASAQRKSWRGPRRRADRPQQS